MRVAIYGGSFNPPHIGHAMVAAWLLWTERVEEVWLVPTGSHAFGKHLLPFERRAALAAALARAVSAQVSVCAVENERPGPSYTIDTLTQLAETYPHHRFQLVVGADILPDTPRWRSWDAIAAQFDPIVVGRGGYPPIEGAPSFPEVSSTAIRALHNAGAPIDHLVPAGVARLLNDVRF